MKIADPWTRLAAAYRLAGDLKAFDSVVKHHPDAVTAIGDLYAADQDWARAIAEYRKSLTRQPADRDLLTRLAFACQAAGRTREAVPYLAAASAANPQDTILSVKVAVLQAWFGQDQELAATRQRVLAFARDTTDQLTARRASRVCTIVPSTDTAELEAALDLARTAVTLGRGDEWNLLALGVAEYRSGNDVAAEKALRATADAGPNNATATGISQFFLAMSLFRQGKPAEARQVAIAATVLLKPRPADEKNPLSGDTNHDDLVLWLAYKEAKAMIHFDAAAAPESRGGN
jgi:tetratricopeptide (TPR) repeat protein